MNPGIQNKQFLANAKLKFFTVIFPSCSLSIFFNCENELFNEVYIVQFHLFKTHLPCYFVSCKLFLIKTEKNDTFHLPDRSFGKIC